MQDLCQRQLGYRQQVRAQLAPPPPMPPPPMARVHTSGTSTRSISPVSRAGSDASSSQAVQPPNYISQGRTPHDGVAHSLSSSSHPESRVQIGHDVREKEVRNMVHDADIDPALQAISDARLQTTPQWPAPAPPLSLPSLKASGLLEWPRPGSTDAAVASSSVQSGSNWQQPPQHFAPPPRQPQRDSVRSFNAHSMPDGSRPSAPSTSSGMPVGLQWLAHESSVSRLS